MNHYANGYFNKIKPRNDWNMQYLEAFQELITTV